MCGETRKDMIRNKHIQEHSQVAGQQWLSKDLAHDRFKWKNDIHVVDVPRMGLHGIIIVL